MNDVVFKGELVGGVVDVFCQRHPAQPLAGMISGEAAEVHDDDLVGGLHLAV